MDYYDDIPGNIKEYINMTTCTSIFQVWIALCIEIIYTIRLEIDYDNDGYNGDGYRN